MKGVPVIADGVPAFPLENKLQQKIDESRIRRKIETDKWNALAEAEYSREIERLCQTIVRHVQKGKLFDGVVTVSWRSKHHSAHVDCTKDRVNQLLTQNHAITVQTLKTNVFSSNDEIGTCCVSSLVCCCLPLFYWIPKCIIDSMYGDIVQVHVTFTK
jgi:uncharacterized membrane-anchored protein YjiN (DUF445 family)